jgi:dihydrofolate reductase
MSRVIASITTSVDGYVTGPDDRPGQGLGVGGERLHYWVFGGPWTYDSTRDMGEVSGADQDHYEALTAEAAGGAGICGRGMYEAAGRWGGTNPFPGPLFVVTSRPDDEPPAADTGFTFVEGFDAALAAARDVAGDHPVNIGGGASVIRQGLAAGVVDLLCVSTAPVVLGGGKRLFEGFEHDLDLTIDRTFTSPLATHVWYRLG